MEPLTAITVLVGQYGIQQLVGAMTGRADLGELASQLFGALSASEDRLSARLVGIEQRLDEVLAQRYEAAVGAGLRGLLDAGGTVDKHVRREELLQARERFREAGAAARSSLQLAVAERYMLLCAIALDREDAARTALRQLNLASTTAALELVEAYKAAGQAALEKLEQRGEARGRGARQRLEAEEARIREVALEAATLVENLLVEAGVVGQVLGQPTPATIKRFGGGDRPAVTPIGWRIEPAASGPTRVGALVVNWDRFEALPATPAKPTRPSTDAPRRLFLDAPPRDLTGTAPGVGAGHVPLSRRDPRKPADGLVSLVSRPTVAVKVELRIEADPPLSRFVSADLPGIPTDTSGRSLFTPPRGLPAGDRSAQRRWPPRPPRGLPAGDRSAQLSDTVSLFADKDGKVAGPSPVFVGGAFTFFRYSGSA